MSDEKKISFLKRSIPHILTGVLIGVILTNVFADRAPEPTSMLQEGKYIELTYEGQVYYAVSDKKWEWVTAEGEAISWDFGSGLSGPSGSDLTAVVKSLRAKEQFKK